MDASTPQPDPEGGHEIVVGYVLRDILDRAEMGKQKYGTYLMSHNGRDPLWDALQETYDLVMYLKQEVIERDSKERALWQVHALLVGSQHRDAEDIAKAAGLLCQVLKAEYANGVE